MARHVEDVFKPCLYIFKIFGLYSLCIGNEDVKRESILGVVWSLIVVFCCMSNAIYGIVHRNVQFKSLLLTLSDTIEICTAFTNASISILFLIVIRKKLSTFLQQLSRCDEEFRKFHKENYKKTKQMNIIIGFILGLILVLIICTYVWFDTTLYMTEINFVMIGDAMAYCFPFIIGLLVTAQFSLMTLLLKQQFVWINEKLIETKTGVNSALIDDEVIRTLENLRRKHDILSSLGSHLNKIYSVPMLLATSHHFIVIIVTCLLHLQDSKPLKQDHSRLLYNLYDCLVIVLHSVETGAMVMICSKTRNEAKNSANILHQFPKTFTDIDSFIQLFSMQLLDEEVEFWACGVFIINETLLFSMVGAITSYLIIVFQMDNDNK
ncbi:putative gustatory receptor 28b isoform X1 [Tribolium madens]|uniref:putative gustatory receptor 28b isoform X1 n=1 Tax=Tribolium madens TaxID=41895 RepID=UPI001CF71D3F|nr:putative gustatory receptor 28b isoform X1 [Tribolium madens]